LVLSWVVWVHPVLADHVNLTADERTYVQNHPIIRVANEQSWPPFNFIERGVPKGYSVEYIKLAAQKVGLKVEFVSGPSWSEFLDMMRAQKLDVMLNIVNTASRREYINFTRAYMISPPAIYTNGVRADVVSLDSLNGHTIAVPKGFFSHDLLVRKYPNIKLHLTRDIVKAMEDVLDDKADAVIADMGVAQYLIGKHNLTGLARSATIADPMFTNALNLGVRKDRPILRDILQKGMDDISDEEINRLRQDWFASADSARLHDPIPFTDTEKAYLKSRDEITMCIDPDWLPYEKFDGAGKHIGMSADYFDVFALRLGKPIQVVRTLTWPDSLAKVRAGKCDILSLAMETPDRTTYLNFTTPYVVSPMVIATRPDAESIADIPSIGKKTVGIVKGYAYVSVFQSKYPEIEVVEVANLDAGLKLVRRGELFGMIGTLATIGYAIQDRYVGDLKISERFQDTIDLSIGVRKDSPELLAIFNKVIDTVKPDQHRSIANKWVAVHYKEVPNYTLLIMLAVVFLIFAAFLIYRQRQLRGHNVVLERLSTTDRLTGLFNRLKLDEMLELRHAEFQRFGHCFSVIMLDIDNFKPVNDQFGHQVGDQVLVKVGEVIKKHARGVDSVGRWGGEEFLIICPETEVSGAVVRAEHIRTEIKNTYFLMDYPLTVSLGVAETRHGEGVKDIVARADMALYAAKANGRDQVKAAEAD